MLDKAYELYPGKIDSEPLCTSVKTFSAKPKLNMHASKDDVKNFTVR